MVKKKEIKRELGMDIININGEEYVKRNSSAKTEMLFFDEVHFVIHRKDIEIKGRLCFYCGETFDKEEIKNLDRHHGINKRLKSKYNVFIPVCKKCHLEINRKEKKLKLTKDKE